MIQGQPRHPQCATLSSIHLQLLLLQVFGPHTCHGGRDNVDHGNRGGGRIDRRSIPCASGGGMSGQCLFFFLIANISQTTLDLHHELTRHACYQVLVVVIVTRGWLVIPSSNQNLIMCQDPQAPTVPDTDNKQPQGPLRGQLQNRVQTVPKCQEKPGNGEGHCCHVNRDIVQDTGKQEAGGLPHNGRRLNQVLSWGSSIRRLGYLVVGLRFLLLVGFFDVIVDTCRRRLMSLTFPLVRRRCCC